MPGLIQESLFKTITVKELHPTFGAEIQGVDFDNLSDEQFDEVKAALAKVKTSLYFNLIMPTASFLYQAVSLSCSDNLKDDQQKG